jgi:hypothetical protein
MPCNIPIILTFSATCILYRLLLGAAVLSMPKQARSHQSALREYPEKWSRPRATCPYGNQRAAGLLDRRHGSWLIPGEPRTAKLQVAARRATSQASRDSLLHSLPHNLANPSAPTHTDTGANGGSHWRIDRARDKEQAEATERRSFA